MDIGKNIKNLRERRGISQRELGAMLGVTQQTIGQLENNKTSPRIETLERVATALNASISDLISPDLLSLTNSVINLFSDSDVKELESSSPCSAQEDYLILKFRELNEDGKIKVTDYTDDLARIPEYKKK